MTELPHCFAVWRSPALIQQSSAMIEHAFSHLRATISDIQHLALGDMTEASLLLKYNRNRPLHCYDVFIVENLAANMQQIGNVEVGSLCLSVVSSSIYLPIRTTVGKAVENREHMFDLCTGAIIDYFQIAGSFPQPSRR